MRSLLRVLLVLTLSHGFSAAAQAQELTPVENQVIQNCEANIAQNRYAPSDAEICLTALQAGDNRLMDKMRALDQERTARILKHENLAKELGDFFDQNDTPFCYIRQKMISTLESGRACVICELNLGPQPEKFLPWINRYAAGLRDESRKAAASWNALFHSMPLTQEFQVRLSSFGYTETEWREKTLRERVAALAAVDVIAFAGRNRTDTAINGCGIMGDDQEAFLQRYMDQEMQTRYKDHTTPPLRGTAAAPVPPPASAAGSRLANTTAGLHGASDADAYSRLGAAFDHSVPGAGGRPQTGTAGRPGGPATGAGTGNPPRYYLTAAEAAALAPRLTDQLVGARVNGVYSGGELAGTQVGDRLLSFYNAKDSRNQPRNPLSFSMPRMSNDRTGAVFCPSGGADCTDYGVAAGQIGLNRTVVETWMRDNAISAEMLTGNSPQYIQRLSRHVAPVFVHEATHQEDNTENYNRRNEVKAFANQAIFLEEKLKNPGTAAAYTRDVRHFDNEILTELRNNGYRGLKQYIRYYDLNGVEGEASDQMRQFEGQLKEQNLRRTSPGYRNPANFNPANCHPAYLAACSDTQLQGLVNRTFPWYQNEIRRQSEDIAYIDGQMARLNRQSIQQVTP